MILFTWGVSAHVGGGVLSQHALRQTPLLGHTSPPPGHTPLGHTPWVRHPPGLSTPPPRDTVNARAVRILLECKLVLFVMIPEGMAWTFQDHYPVISVMEISKRNENHKTFPHMPICLNTDVNSILWNNSDPLLKIFPSHGSYSNQISSMLLSLSRPSWVSLLIMIKCYRLPYLKNKSKKCNCYSRFFQL